MKSDLPNGGEKPPHNQAEKRKPPLANRILEKAAREQLAGPFGKLGRYALKQQGLTIWEREEKIAESTVKKNGTKTEGLFSRMIKLLKRPFKIKR